MAFWRRQQSNSVIDERIRKALAQLRPSLPSHAVALDLVAFERGTGVARVSVRGECNECDMPLSILRNAIEVRLRMSVPEIRSVELEEEPGDG